MAAYGGCGSTVFTGDVPAELLGVKSWEFGEELESTKYSDNTTGCGKKTIKGPIAQTVKLTYHFQDGVAKGKIPIRAGEEVPAELHIDDTGANYWECDLLCTGVQNVVYDNSSSEPVSCEIMCDVQGEVVGVGTLVDA